MKKLTDGSKAIEPAEIISPGESSTKEIGKAAVDLFSALISDGIREGFLPPGILNAFIPSTCEHKTKIKIGVYTYCKDCGEDLTCR